MDKIVFDTLLKEAQDDEALKLRYIQITYLLDTASFLADMADSFIRDADVRMLNVGLCLKRDEKVKHKMLKDLITKTRLKAKECYSKTIKTDDEIKRIWVEDRSQQLYQMMKLIVNRTTNDNQGMQEIYDAVKALPIKRDIFDETHL